MNCGKSTIRKSTSKYIGVSYCERGNTWCASARVDGKARKIGQYFKEEDAAKARDYYVRRERGVFAVLNFPEIDELPAKTSYSNTLGRKHISIVYDRRTGEAILKYRIEMRYRRKNLHITNTRLTLEEAVEWRNAKLTELGIPIPD